MLTKLGIVWGRVVLFHRRLSNNGYLYSTTRKLQAVLLERDPRHIASVCRCLSEFGVHQLAF